MCFLPKYTLILIGPIGLVCHAELAMLADPELITNFYSYEAFSEIQRYLGLKFIVALIASNISEVLYFQRGKF